MSTLTSEVRVAVKDANSAREMLDRADLLFTVGQHSIITGSGISVDSHKAIIREDTNSVLGVVGAKYQPIQNQDAFGFLDILCKQYDAKYQYVYNINGGAQVIAQAKINGGFDARPGDHVDKFITVMNSHDGSSALRVFFTAYRLFCMNQMNIAYRTRDRAQSISIRHTANIKERFEEAANIFHIGVDAFSKFEVKAQSLANKAVGKVMVEKFLDTVVGEAFTEDGECSTRTQNKRDRITELFESGQGNRGESAWDLLNAVTEYVDWWTNPTNDNRRFKSAMLGNGNLIKQKALVAALAM